MVPAQPAVELIGKTCLVYVLPHGLPACLEDIRRRKRPRCLVRRKPVCEAGLAWLLETSEMLQIRCAGRW